MKAAVIYQPGELPQYTDHPEPVPQNENEILATVKAVAIKHLDKGRAAGTHYSTQKAGENIAPQIRGAGKIIGGDGVFITPDGQRVYALGVSGTIAEKATIEADRMVPIPDDLDDATAAALPNAIAGSAMALRFKADIQPGDTVLVNGATGFTGRMAVQLAKYYGAGKIIATGRDKRSLEDLKNLGADEFISLTAGEESIKAQLKKLHSTTPIDIVIDYLWGRSAEYILNIIKGDGSFTNRIRYVSVGAMTDDLIQLSAENLRSVDLQLSGSGLGAWSKQQVGILLKEIIPEMFRLAAEGRLSIITQTVNIQDIAELWHLEVPSGHRLVVTV